MFSVREQLITFKLCSSNSIYSEIMIQALKEHILSKEVNMLTQRKMFDSSKLSKQLIYHDR